MILPSRALRKNGPLASRFFLSVVCPARTIHQTSAPNVPIKSQSSVDTSLGTAKLGSLPHAEAVTGTRSYMASPSSTQAPKLNAPLPRSLGPRARVAGFQTSIARQELGFMPLESSIIFPSLEFTSAKSLEPEIRVPFTLDNTKPVRPAEPKPALATRPMISTVSPFAVVSSPSAIIEGLSVAFTFPKEPAAEEGEGDRMLRAFRLGV